jgi:hypothetical protein
MRPRSSERLERVQRVHPYQWLWEPLEMDPSFVLRPMFGAKTVYLGGQLMLCFCASEEPWRGVLVCTSREHHEALRAEFPELTSHAILPKWLYLPEACDAFERIAAQLVGLARRRDPRLGVMPGATTKKKPKTSRPARRRPRPGL